jgi:hypothetical protein
MFKYKYNLLFVLIFFFVSSSSYAEVSDKSIDELLDLSGLTMQVNQFPDLIKAGVERAKYEGTPIPDDEYNLLLNSVDDSILSSEIIEGIRSSLKKSIDEKDVKNLFAWYKSELGREITQAEESATTPAAYQQMMQSARSLLANKERIAFANRLDTLLGATDMTMDIQEQSNIAIYSAIMTAMRPNIPLNLEPLKVQMDATREQMYAGIKQMVNISFVYTYQNIEKENLTKYESFLDEPSTMKFNKIIKKGLKRELKVSVSKWAETLAMLYKSKQQGD